eukprot:1134840-Pelagomonas_calceolata.AAC.1
MGDVVVVINASQVHLTHDKWQTKVYRWHTGGCKQDCREAGRAESTPHMTSGSAPLALRVVRV